jgi:hypothetical protein
MRDLWKARGLTSAHCFVMRALLCLSTQRTTRAAFPTLVCPQTYNRTYDPWNLSTVCTCMPLKCTIYDVDIDQVVAFWCSSRSDPVRCTN